MSPVAQAFDGWPRRGFRSACLQLAVLGAVFALAGCGAGGFSLDQADLDRSIVTSSVSPASPKAPAPGMDIAADRNTIRNAVSSADIDQLAGKPLAWANPETGARGAITQLAQSRRAGRICRSFGGSRESFDGVSMFKGQTCMAGPDLWRIEAFKVL